jgi:hypothetical protein
MQECGKEVGMVLGIASSHVRARLIRSWYHFDCMGANMGIRFEFTYQYVDLYCVLGHPYVTTN